MTVTLKQIAEKLDISPGTVSLALSGSPLVAAKTRELVLETADAMGYKPSNLGRALRSGKSSLVGCFSSDARNSFFWELFLGMSRKLAERDYGLLFSSPQSADPKEIERCTNFMLRKNVDGIVFAGGLGTKEYVRIVPELRKRDIPFVFCSQHMEEENLPFVVTDDFAGGRMAVEYLAEQGHRSILCQETRNIPLRLQGNIAAAESCGLRYVSFREPDEIPGLLRTVRATAVTAYCDSEALKIMNVLKKENVKVPDEISVIGYDDLFFAGHCEFGLTTVAQKHGQLGEIAIEYLFDRFDGKNTLLACEVMPEIMIRNSVAAVKVKEDADITDPDTFSR